MKKLLSLILALTLVLALAAPVFAADTGSITVDNAVAVETYTAYKILDVIYDTEKTAYAYTITTSSEWYSVVDGYTTGLKLTPTANDATKFVVEKLEGFDVVEFTKLLSENMSGKTGIQLDNDGHGTATKDGLSLGYYFVTSSVAALCNLTTTNPDVTIHDKNDNPFDKVDDKSDVEVGEVVNYTLAGRVPDTTGFTSYTYQFTDMSTLSW